MVTGGWITVARPPGLLALERNHLHDTAHSASRLDDAHLRGKARFRFDGGVLGAGEHQSEKWKKDEATHDTPPYG